MAGMWLWTFASTNSNVLVVRRNLIFPSTIFVVFSVAYFLISKIFANPRVRTLFIIFCSLFIVSIDLFRFHHKFIPYIDSSMWYPQLPVLRELENRQGRSFGLLEGNLNLPLRIYSLDGYDPMVSSEYVKLTYPSEELAKRNRVTEPYFPKGQPETVDLVGRLGGKWFVDSATPGGASWDLRLWEYGGQFVNVWKDDKYQILLNVGAADEVIEPTGGLRFWQYRLFLLGTVISGVTIMTLWLTRKL